MNKYFHSIVWDPIFATPFIVLLWLGLAGLAWWSTWRKVGQLSRLRRLWLTFLRTLGLTLLCLPLLQPAFEQAIPQLPSHSALHG